MNIPRKPALAPILILTQSLFILVAGCTAAPTLMPTEVSNATLTASPTLAPTDMPTSTLEPSPTTTYTATAFNPALPSGIVVTRDITYSLPVAQTASEWLLDIYAPIESGAWPVIVVLSDSTDDFDIQSLAQTIAADGAVVFVPNDRPEGGDVLFRDDRPGLRENFENTACVIRYARANAGEYGGNPEQIVTIGHSGTGYFGMWVALAGDELETNWDGFASDQDGPSKQVDCVAPYEVSAQPDVLIGYAGAYVYFEQFSSEDPTLFELVNPTTYIGHNPDLIIRILEATKDETRPKWANESTRQFYEQLAEAGYDVELTEVVAAHGLGRSAREAVVQVLWETIGPSQ